MLDEKTIYNIVDKAQKYDRLLFLQNKIELHCSFCGKSESAIEKLIAGAGVYICNKCVDFCVEIIKEEKNDVSNESEKLNAKTINDGQ